MVDEVRAAGEEPGLRIVGDRRDRLGRVAGADVAELVHASDTSRIASRMPT